MTDDRAAIVELLADGAEFLFCERVFAGHEGVGKMFRDAPCGLHRPSDTPEVTPS
ncbi:hypothetical protein [Mycobacterium sp. HNNTM2301]|uniref:hypothetical protein n=1 Tax=Mycobacterium hainanense TaxID=3289775 RepID=UPI0035A6A263